MYNNSSMNNSCGCNHNHNSYKAMPKNCNVNCQCDEIVVNALNNMEKYLAETNEVRVAFTQHTDTLNETNVLQQDLSKEDVLYSRFDKALQYYVQGNYNYERTLNQIISAYNCCTLNNKSMTSQCQTYIDAAKKAQSDILNINGQLATKLNELQQAAIKSGEANGVVAVSIFGFNEPLNLSFMSIEEESEYQTNSYMMKVDGYNCCKNDKHTCGSCPCYDPRNPLCQCDEIMRQSQEKRLQAEREGLYSQGQQKILQEQTQILTTALKTSEDSANNVYSIMDAVIKLEITLKNTILQGIDAARKAYMCCSSMDTECTQHTNTYSYTTNYKYDYSYNPYNTCKEECPVTCDSLIQKAERIYALGDSLTTKADALYASLKVEINNRIEIQSQAFKLYQEAAAGIATSMEHFNTIAKNIYANVLCKLDEAYLCCTKQC
ncbi:MAG: hypothetical protein ACRCXT_03365 [Paraclostridium sp.]